MSFCVSKQAPELVAPGVPTPSGRLPLSSMDRTAVVRILVDLVLVFKHGLEPAKTIKAALSRALVPYYPVAGRIVEPSPGEPEVACTSDGVWFVEASADYSLEGVNNLERPLVLRKEELLPFAPLQVNVEDLIFMMQGTVAGASLVDVMELIRDAKERLSARFLAWMMGESGEDPYKVPREYGTVVVSDWSRVGRADPRGSLER
ncbi:3'-N-debenzoyl-2'-deoxytaxol N-benzoyltransferase [Musa troglodytarum]|uniref:3'-N-debenzoyl-2'-deoxytaxol N-benzoyltransferase n=1 Tax=Musa troglodytarum TaxID=320322 RepID=A0A9E7EET6_9LILI|nr:3'-N-debenzoyl-2'-deoxytaxol N-benzoyltransferase [Musa troglodytarum]